MRINDNRDYVAEFIRSGLIKRALKGVLINRGEAIKGRIVDFGVNNEVETRIRVHKFYGCIKGGRKGWSLWGGNAN